MILNPANYWKVMAGLFVAILIFAALFFAFPELDLIVSGWFYDPISGQFAGRSAFFLGLREIINGTFNLLVIVLLVLWVFTFVRGAKSTLGPSWFWGFPLITILIGPGVLVNLILKAHWGRARPDAVFAGDAEFSLPFIMTDQCAANCSFVSGEASSLATLAMLIAILIGPHFSRKRLIYFACGALAVYGCFIRIYMGRHFLSDTIFAVLFCAVVLWVFWGLFQMGQRHTQIPSLIRNLSIYGFFAKRDL